MSWYLLAIINVLATAAGNLFQKLSMVKEESNPVAASVIFQFLLGFLTLIFGLFHGIKFPPLYLTPYFIISGILYAVGTVSYFNAYKYIGASEGTVIGGAGIIMTVIASMLFLHDKLSLLQIFGILLILSAVILVSWTSKKFTVNRGMWLALIATSAYGLAVVCDSFIVRHYDAVSYLSLICFLPGSLIFLRYSNQAKAIFHAARHIDRNLFIFSILYSVQAIAFYIALGMGALVAQINSISRVAIILTVILATIFLKETKYIPRKIIAAILTTAGVLLVAK